MHYLCSKSARFKKWLLEYSKALYWYEIVNNHFVVELTEVLKLTCQVDTMSMILLICYEIFQHLSL